MNRENDKRKDSILLLLLFFILLLTGLVLVFPKEPLGREVGVDENGLPMDAYENLRISEVMAANVSAVADKSGVYYDYIEIWNSGPSAIDLYQVGLSDRRDAIRFLFPSIILPPNGYVVVFASGLSAQDPDKGLHAKFKLSALGRDQLTLTGPDKTVLNYVLVPKCDENMAYLLLEDGSYELSALYSPGYPNTQEGHQAYINGINK